jgi:hypothetical protein
MLQQPGERSREDREKFAPLEQPFPNGKCPQRIEPSHEPTLATAAHERPSAEEQ